MRAFALWGFLGEEGQEWLCLGSARARLISHLLTHPTAYIHQRYALCTTLTANLGAHHGDGRTNLADADALARVCHRQQ